MKLTPKQQKFADYYIASGNGSESYKKTYSGCKKDDTARVNASKLLTKANICEYIATKREEIAKENKWTMERLIKEFEEIKDRCMENIPVLDREGLPTGEYKFEHSGANKSLENIGKLLGYYTDKVEVTEKHIVVDIEDDEE